MEKLKKLLSLSAQWILTVCITLIGIIIIFQTWESGLVFLMLGLLTAPPVRKMIDLKISDIQPKHYAITWVVLLIAAFYLLNGHINEEQIREDQVAAQQAKAEQDAEEAEQRRYFLENKDSLLSAYRQMYENGQYQDMLNHSEYFASISQDPDLLTLRSHASNILQQASNQARTQELLESLRSTRDGGLTSNKMAYKAYQELVELNPGKQEYVSGLEEYRRKIAAQEAESKRLTAIVGPKPKRDGWSRTYQEVEDYLASVANEPDSIRIEGCTIPYLRERGWYVKCDYRGRNGTGGIKRQTGWFTIRHNEVVASGDRYSFSP